jgi:hypothetical protein
MSSPASPADRRRLMLGRISTIRKRVAAATIALFLAAFLVVYVQLASGHDPALTASERSRAAVKQSSSSTASPSGGATSSAPSSGESSTAGSSETSSSTSGGSSSGGSASAGSSESSEAEAVTTKQS